MKLGPSSRGNGLRKRSRRGNSRRSLVPPPDSPAGTAQASRRPRSHNRCTCITNSMGCAQDDPVMIESSTDAAQPLGTVFLDGEVAHSRASTLFVVHEAHGSDVGLDDVNLLERCDDQKL